MVGRRSREARSWPTSTFSDRPPCRQRCSYSPLPMRAATRFITRLWAPAGVRGLAWMATAPLSVAYAGILAGRSAWWERFAQFPPLPTVSVGNLAIGGSGKTPFTLFLATRLQRSGVSVGIVSRGYGGEASRQARLVSDGRYMGMTARQAGDEPVML